MLSARSLFHFYLTVVLRRFTRSTATFFDLLVQQGEEFLNFLRLILEKIFSFTGIGLEIEQLHFGKALFLGDIFTGSTPAATSTTET